MRRSLLLLCLLYCPFLPVWGQCVIDKDSHGQVVTTCEQYNQPGPNQLASYSHKQTHYLGSEFFTFPSMEAGTVQIDPSSQVKACQLAYNVVDNTVSCLFNDGLKATTLTPYAFTINGVRFVRQHVTTLGINYLFYTTLLYTGPTQLLKSVSNRLVQKAVANGYEKGSHFDGYFQTQEKFYIRKGEAALQATTLSKQSLLTLLYDQAASIAPRLEKKQLTIRDVVDALTYYDSLTSVVNIGKPLLSQDAAFNDFLHRQISYPNQAWTNAVYGRVYAGFDVDTAGQIRNITLLSPDNGGFGFDKAVRQALGKVALVKSVYAGRYALPVAFTYANRQEQGPVNVPVQRLSVDRLTDRILLHEFVVPVVVSKPVTTSREVWGYYK